MARPKLLLPEAAAILELLDEQGLLAVRVSANASGDAVILPSSESPNMLMIRTTAAAEHGKANEAVLRLLAHAIDRPVSALELARGAKTRNKLVRITADPG